MMMKCIGKWMWLAGLCLLPWMATAQQTRSWKRGVSENAFNYVEDIRALATGVSWFYNWGDTPPAVYDELENSEAGVEFLPMAWGGSFNEENIRATLTKYPGIKYLLGFNEPNFKAQANMTPAQAAELWPRLEKIADDFGLELVGPALNYSPDAPYQDPTAWYDEFFSLYPEARCDYLALHCYMDDADAMMNFINRIYERYNRRIWLTEFCAWNSPNITAESQRSSMVMKVEALELSDAVARYAWFKARGTTKYPYYPLLKYPSETIPKGTLTDLGQVYVHMSTFDLDHYYPLGTIIPASDYVKSSLVSVEPATDPESPYPLQLEKFSISRSVDYLVDVPEAGTYPLTLRMAGVEDLFNPYIEVYADGVKVAEQELEPTGSVDVWATRSISVPLPAGKVRVTLRSTKNTTCKISWLGFGLDPNVSIGAVRQTPLSVYLRDDALVVESAVPVRRMELHGVDGRVCRQTSGGGRLSLRGVPCGAYLLTAVLENGERRTYKHVVR